MILLVLFGEGQLCNIVGPSMDDSSNSGGIERKFKHHPESYDL